MLLEVGLDGHLACVDIKGTKNVYNVEDRQLGCGVHRGM